MALADDIAALKAAIRRGVRSVAYDGHSVVYQSAAEMKATLAQMEREAGTKNAAAMAYPEFSRDGA